MIITVAVIIYHIYASACTFHFDLPFFQKNSFLDKKQADFWVGTDIGFTWGGAAKEMPMPTLRGGKFGSPELTSSGRSSMLTLTNYFFLISK